MLPNSFEQQKLILILIFFLLPFGRFFSQSTFLFAPFMINFTHVYIYQLISCHTNPLIHVCLHRYHEIIPHRPACISMKAMVLELGI